MKNRKFLEFLAKHGEINPADRLRLSLTQGNGKPGADGDHAAFIASTFLLDKVAAPTLKFKVLQRRRWRIAGNITTAVAIGLVLAWITLGLKANSWTPWRPAHRLVNSSSSQNSGAVCTD